MSLEKLCNVSEVTEEIKELEIKFKVDRIAMPLIMSNLSNGFHRELKDKSQVVHLQPSPGHEASKVTYLSIR